MHDLQNRKLTIGEKMGVSAALIMFVAVGMIMGGTTAGNDNLVLAGGGIFSIGAAIALYLLFKHKPKDKDF
jgi:hypothetical protein